MKRLLVVWILTTLSLTPVALAGNTSSNSSSNSSNGVHTRVDTIITDDDHGQTIYMRRTVRNDRGRGRSTYIIREREKYGHIREREKYDHRPMRRWYPADDDDD